MTRREEIIFATLELASEYGLKAVSLTQIAERVGIKKPSLYNHFRSKDEIVSAMYSFLREQAKNGSGAPVDYTKLITDHSLEEILMFTLSVYVGFLFDRNMMSFFRVLYSERSTSPVAAQIMLEETERMTAAVRNLFYALAVHGRIRNEDVDTAALSYAMTVHSLVDRQMDTITAGQTGVTKENGISEDMRQYVSWFAKQMEVKKDE